MTKTYVVVTQLEGGAAFTEYKDPVAISISIDHKYWSIMRPYSWQKVIVEIANRVKDSEIGDVIRLDGNSVCFVVKAGLDEDICDD